VAHRRLLVRSSGAAEWTGWPSMMMVIACMSAQGIRVRLAVHCLATSVDPNCTERDPGTGERRPRPGSLRSQCRRLTL
jgi:hypothetical protein